MNTVGISSNDNKWLTSLHYACVNWQCGRWQFSTIFLKKQYLSNGQANCREISHKYCK